MMAASLSSSFVFYQSFYDMTALIPDSETQLAAYAMLIYLCRPLSKFRLLDGQFPQLSILWQTLV